MSSLLFLWGQDSGLLFFCFVLFCLPCCGLQDLSSPQECMLSHVQLLVTPWALPPRLPCPWSFPGQDTEWVAISSSSDIPNPGIKTRASPVSPALQGESLLLSQLGSPS